MDERAPDPPAGPKGTAAHAGAIHWAPPATLGHGASHQGGYMEGDFSPPGSTFC